MLLRMYCKHAIKVGLSMELIDMTPYEPDGIRTATLRLAGDSPYGRLKTESGVHRLSRVSPFDQADRRQTSFASVEVIPEAREAKLVVDPKEIEAWTCCGGGPGGQHVNKRETVACFRHIPTGISVRCQNERSQAANKVAAMGLLMAKLAKKLDEDRRTEEAKSRDAAPRAAFGGRHARTYVLSQRPAIHDHRTGKSTSQVDDVLNGDLSDLL
jgi:peptide chain release factor 2